MTTKLIAFAALTSCVFGMHSRHGDVRQDDEKQGAAQVRCVKPGPEFRAKLQNNKIQEEPKIKQLLDNFADVSFEMTKCKGKVRKNPELSEKLQTLQKELHDKQQVIADLLSENGMADEIKYLTNNAEEFREEFREDGYEFWAEWATDLLIHECDQPSKVTVLEDFQTKLQKYSQAQEIKELLEAFQDMWIPYKVVEKRFWNSARTEDMHKWSELTNELQKKQDHIAELLTHHYGIAGEIQYLEKYYARCTGEGFWAQWIREVLRCDDDTPLSDLRRPIEE